MSLLEARKNVPLMVISFGELETERRSMGSRGRRRGRGRGNWYRRFSKMGIIEGSIIKKISMHPFFGPIIIRVGNCEMAVGRRLASSIIVKEIGQ
jgi:Fe2+ transport system protein FeoA